MIIKSSKSAGHKEISMSKFVFGCADTEVTEISIGAKRIPIIVKIMNVLIAF